MGIEPFINWRQRNWEERMRECIPCIWEYAMPMPFGNWNHILQKKPWRN